MVLNDEQCLRFFDTMDALLYYVNERFRVVENFTLDYNGQIGDMKTALVAHALWDNVEIIDEFVRDNPARLPQRCLDTALSWKTALRGLFTVVRYQNGRAIMMNDAGLFAVGGVTNEIQDEIGPAPAFVDLVLIPFDEGIVYDGFLQAYDGDGTVDEATRIQDEFENRCAQGIVTTAADFSKIAGEHLEAERSKELDALLSDVALAVDDADEELPAGFHRGALAGLDGVERDEAIAAEFNRRMQDDDETLQDFIADGDELEGDYASLSGDEGGVTRPDENLRGKQDRSDKPTTSSTDAPDSAAQSDPQADRAVNCAIASVLARGIVELGEAYEQYRALVHDPLPRDDFEQLVRFEASFSDSYFGIWTYQKRDYLVYYTLTPDYIAQMAGLEGDWSTLRSDLDYYEQYRRDLLVTRSEMQPKPLSRTLLENTPLGELLRDENVIRLRNYLDERIPDGQDDYAFADLAAQEFVLTAIEGGGLEPLFRLADDLGISDCSSDESRLTRYVTNVFNAMPSWENNGWSPQELYEQLTGRRLFYNNDGSVKKLAETDPCPCGSGKLYRDCCGR